MTQPILTDNTAYYILAYSLVCLRSKRLNLHHLVRTQFDIMMSVGWVEGTNQVDFVSVNYIYTCALGIPHVSSCQNVGEKYLKYLKEANPSG